jgi:pyrimidine 5'-nucleotidase
MIFDTIFFDLDDTLYPSTNGLRQILRNRIELYMMEIMKISPEIVPNLRKELFLKYGTSLRGLSTEYSINEQEFLDFVHDVPLKNYIQPDPNLRMTLELYPQKKVIFTNADTNHANRVIGILGLEGVFDQIIDIRDIHPYCKPQIEAFQKALLLARVNDPHECVMIDDAHRNLLSAKEMGLFTIQIGLDDCPPNIDASIITLIDLPSVIPV